MGTSSFHQGGAFGGYASWNWRGLGVPGDSIPSNAILDESGNAILDENGDYILTE